ncbi:hypothetical protein SR914_23225 [Comamonas testosteroni]|uniref:Uncharacterized protein n=1 Tax=Comamonas testosteroni (strain DSM 14576 / KF-1) TaxID=399795 RepID=B7WXS1_COMTK|nr:hypothetical protein [Comamonas testosteroni]EED67923.1 conserved hypothetical protein [Comamonas testosteroni KF-1]WQG66040.1 hypothetical protein SR914_23225 [Comamonas testosteroni]
MGEINIPSDERDALKSIDAAQLRDAIEKCIDQRYSTDLASFRLFSCGIYVNNQLGSFDRALANYRDAKSAKKVSDTRYEAEKLGRNLLFSVQEMQSRLKQEEEDEKLFKVHDNIMPPSRFNEQLTVRVQYQWRETVEDKWTFGSIAFVHNVVERPDYTATQPSRKPSASQMERTRQEELFSQWSYLMSLSLCSVRDFFKDGKDGASIPLTFQARPDERSGRLNNHSVTFWRDEH